ncbi:TadE/TadG family type IV pilus assembly protein [uncultured Alsobacter sp.]|uniref:TadE/TadG family type IV pilus assembly protein n=1 Tax=uncultured Alsobacter sp. TaxID=1748258 RepID=UPI0025D6D998|nr:TadE/TadG family type IV pilus assembly protein [uncultured Alsobacter sp.]
MNGSSLLGRFLRCERGGPLVEATVMMPLLFVFLLGSVDFLNGLYQYNAAAKAVQMGARLAAVSDPVATGLNNLCSNGSACSTPGGAMPNFTVTCSGGSATCTCTGTCTGVGNAPALSTAALRTIVFGRSNGGTCGTPTGRYTMGMCHMFPGLAVNNVVVTYRQTGLGYDGRPGGPVPTVSVSLQNLTFSFYFLGALSGFANIQIPGLATTVTGEALSSSAQCFTGPC